MALPVIQDYISNLAVSWKGLTMSKKAMVITGSLALLYCTSQIYSKRDKIIPQIVINMPESVRFAIVNKFGVPGTMINADIYPYALWMVYRIDPDKIDKIEQLLPSSLTIMKHKIFAADKNEDYYLCYNIYMSSFRGLESIRLEINVIAKNTENKGCWVIIDYYTDAIRFDPMAPLYPPNCHKKYFIVNDLNVEGNKKTISAGIYIKNQEKKHDLFDFIVDVDLNDKPLISDKIWITANDEIYAGGHDTKKLDQYAWICHAQFEQKEHENYKNVRVKHAVNNLFTAIRGELVTCFVIPNRQNYTLTI